MWPLNLLWFPATLNFIPVVLQGTLLIILVFSLSLPYVSEHKRKKQYEKWPHECFLADLETHPRIVVEVALYNESETVLLSELKDWLLDLTELSVMPLAY